MRSRLLALLSLLSLACSPSAAPTPPPAPTPAPSRPPAPPDSAAAPTPPPPPARLDRAGFNRTAVRLNLPLYWAADRNGNGAPDPDEIAALRFFSTTGAWVDKGAFTDAYRDAERRIETLDALSNPGADLKDTERRKLVAAELDNASPSLVATDLTQASAQDRAFARAMLQVATHIDRLYSLQTGAAALAAQVPADDPASQSLFRRSWGPRCLTPGFDTNPACSAIPGAPRQKVDIYPSDLQDDPKFCAALEQRKDKKSLLDPFTVVRKDDKGALRAVSYSEAYHEPMTAIATALRAAAAELKEGEKPLIAYLEAAAKSFTTNDWRPADEAWSKMSAENSRWYVRVGPDETYWEPCSQKAGFHLAFARINPDSLRWQTRLKPVQQAMEDALAAHIGAPYKARKVTFHLPDFIDIVVNAGDDRGAVGATIGQSLPNWGPVAAQGRGRTVAMSNLYTDPDSLAVRRAKVDALMHKDTASVYVDQPDPGLVSTILHEASHNLGPSHEYRYQGKKDSEAFGGDLASMLEELKAQTAGLWYVSFLQKRGILDEKLARQVYVDSLIWAFNHISRGMWTASHQRKHYSQLAAIQVGFLLDQKALVFEPDTLSASGQERGAYRLDFDKLPAALDALTREVGHLKAAADKTTAEALSARYVDGMADHHKRIAERCLRYPQPTFVYAVTP